MRKLGVVLVLAAFLNFILFFVVSMRLGGDAIKGKVENGEYFVANREKLTKVTPTVWHYSRAHARSLLLTHPLGIVGFGILAVTLRSRKTTARTSEPTPS
jgi:hypothetical protein